MKKTMILAAIAALVSLASCQKEEVIDNNGSDKSASPVFTASIAGATKTTFDLTEGKVAWETTDEITVTDASSASAIYKIESIDATAGKLYMTAPATSNNSFEFTVQCGLMKLNLTKTGESVKSIAVTGTPTGGSKTTYTLTCAEAQSIESAKDFYIALPAGSYTRIKITNASGAFATLNSASGVAVAANHIKPVTLGYKIYFLPVGALAGKFTVSDSEKVVYFSKGNLYWDGDSFEFEANQYDIQSSWNASHVNQFNWSQTASVAVAASYSDSGSTDDVFFHQRGCFYCKRAGGYLESTLPRRVEVSV